MSTPRILKDDGDVEWRIPVGGSELEFRSVITQNEWCWYHDNNILARIHQPHINAQRARIIAELYGVVQ